MQTATDNTNSTNTTNKQTPNGEKWKIIKMLPLVGWPKQWFHSENRKMVDIKKQRAQRSQTYIYTSLLGQRISCCVCVVWGMNWEENRRNHFICDRFDAVTFTRFANNSTQNRLIWTQVCWSFQQKESIFLDMALDIGRCPWRELHFPKW